MNFLNKISNKKIIVGIDEAGRGALAGPVIAVAIGIKKEDLPEIYENFSMIKYKKGFKDSKLLSEKQREKIFEKIFKCDKLKIGIGTVSPYIIDKINILNATILSWKKAIKNLNTSFDYLFLDGKTKIPDINVLQFPYVKADRKILICSLASIVAKVIRDNLMKKLHNKYPNYYFSKNKGYGTKIHIKCLKKFGPCEIHRKSFSPVFESMKFKEKVYFIVSKIPRGKTLTYKKVAELAGSPFAFRAVGNILNKNKDKKIPCHRVIRSDKTIGGYNKGIEEKIKLLKKENAI